GLVGLRIETLVHLRAWAAHAILPFRSAIILPERCAWEEGPGGAAPSTAAELMQRELLDLALELPDAVLDDDLGQVRDDLPGDVPYDLVAQELDNSAGDPVDVLVAQAVGPQGDRPDRHSCLRRRRGGGGERLRGPVREVRQGLVLRRVRRDRVLHLGEA